MGKERVSALKIVSGSPGTDDEGKFPKRFPPRNEPNSKRGGGALSA